MTQQQFIEEIKRLSVKDRIALIEAISRSLQEEFEENGESGSDVGAQDSESEEQSEREQKLSAVERLHGIIKPDGLPPTDEEVKEDYVKYLMEKYS